MQRQRRPDEIEGAEGVQVTCSDRATVAPHGRTLRVARRDPRCGQHDWRSIHGDNHCGSECLGKRGRRHARPAADVDDPSNLSAVHIEQIGAQCDRLVGQAGRELSVRLEGSCKSVIVERSRVAARRSVVVTGMRHTVNASGGGKSGSPPGARNAR